MIAARRPAASGGCRIAAFALEPRVPAREHDGAAIGKRAPFEVINRVRP